jgi:Calcium/calmodulin dependent protein kinase II association domain
MNSLPKATFLKRLWPAVTGLDSRKCAYPAKQTRCHDRHRIVLAAPGGACDNFASKTENTMQKRWLTVFILLFALSLGAAAESHKVTKKTSTGPAPDKAYMQKVLDGWSTLDPADAAKFYASGTGTFFDVTPLKYASWEDYEAGVRKIVTNWGTATIKEDALLKNGKREIATQRWTVVWEKRDGKWLIVHDHTSEPLQ